MNERTRLAILMYVAFGAIFLIVFSSQIAELWEWLLSKRKPKDPLNLRGKLKHEDSAHSYQSIMEAAKSHLKDTGREK